MKEVVQSMFEVVRGCESLRWEAPPVHRRTNSFCPGLIVIGIIDLVSELQLQLESVIMNWNEPPLHYTAIVS